ncbi:FHA domain-containing protein [Prosthecobacter sp.]|uniref:FHA domain-containing protein n=1 Tax=Prosthecobacter sp. TaxID=1965333 RepID=UPI0037849B4F
MSNPIIRITHEEAASSHVDDLIKRQMSMRGDPGVTRHSARRWYYQSWFIFMIVGFIGAMCAWGVTEPWFNDYEYTQGVVSDLDYGFTPDATDKDLVLPLVSGHLKVNGEEIVLLQQTRELLPDGTTRKLTHEALKNGDTAGFYVEYKETPSEEISLCVFVVRAPPPAPAGEKPMTLRAMAKRSTMVGLLLFSIVAGFIGFFIGAADGIVCRLPRRAFLSGLVGLFVGVVGGLVSGVIANIVYQPLTQWALSHGGETGGLSTAGFGIQMLGRTLAWGLAGMTMGLGQGIALRSQRLIAYGFIGGIVGGLLGGLFFDPVDIILLGTDKPSAHVSRLVGLGIIGLSVGAMIGVVELLARDAWLQMTQGPLKGKEFLIFKDVMHAGSSPRSDLYLFNDPQIAEQHMVIRAVGEDCEVETKQPATHPVLINGRAVKRARLKHGDTVALGNTQFVFQKRKN